MESGPGPESGDLTELVRLLTLRVYSLEVEVAKLRAEEAPSVIGPLPSTPVVGAGRHPRQSTQSLENRLGSQVFNRIGVLAILIGAAWALKLAIDNQWIGAIGRIAIGLLAGASIILWSERFRRKSFPVFSYSMKAIGTGVLYLSLWAAFQIYHLMPAGVAFAAMLLVTGWNAWMAWSQDAELLAAYALAGGFATPGLLSTGENHPVILFGYLFVLCAAVVGLVALKPWPRLLAGAIPATVAYYIGWYSRFYTEDQFWLVAFFTLLIYVLFVIVPLVRLIAGSVILTVGAPLAAGAFGSLAFYSLLQDSGRHGWLPWGAVLLGAFYLGLMRVQSRFKPNPATEAIHLTLAIVFLTIAIPLKASGRWITVGWLAEGVSLYWIAVTRVSNAPARIATTLRWLALAALTLGYVGALTLPWWATYAVQTPFLNAHFATQIFAMGALGGVVYFDLRQERPVVAAASSIALNLLVLIAMRHEIFGALAPRGATAEQTIVAEFASSAFWMVHGAILLAIGFWKRIAFVRWQGLILLVATILKVFLYDMRSLSQGYRVLSFIGLGALLMAVSFAYQKDWLGLKGTAANDTESAV